MIKFAKHLYAGCAGRNGYATQSGISAYRHPDRIILYPVNSRGDDLSGSCITVPLDKVDALKRELDRLSENFVHHPTACPSNHWNRGDDICADCGKDLQA